MPEHTPTVGMERKLAAIFSTDVAGYSRLMGDDEEATIRTLTASREIISFLIQHHRGRVIDSPGDNLLAEFASVVDAVRSAVEIQHALKEKNAELPEHRRMQFRIGINWSDMIVEGERLYGDGYLAFREDEKGRITHLLLDFVGSSALEKLPWYETTAVQSSLMGLLVLAFLSACLVWPAGALMRWWRKRPSTAPRPARLARCLAGLVSVLGLLFLAGLNLASAWMGWEFVYGMPPFAERRGL